MIGEGLGKVCADAQAADRPVGWVYLTVFSAVRAGEIRRASSEMNREGVTIFPSQRCAYSLSPGLRQDFYSEFATSS